MVLKTCAASWHCTFHSLTRWLWTLCVAVLCNVYVWILILIIIFMIIILWFIATDRSAQVPFCTYMGMKLVLYGQPQWLLHADIVVYSSYLIDVSVGRSCVVAWTEDIAARQETTWLAKEIQQWEQCWLHWHAGPLHTSGCFCVSEGSREYTCG